MGSHASEQNQILSSDRIHNRNCYAYLLQLKPFYDESLIDFLPSLLSLSEYDETVPYGDVYTNFMTALEMLVEHNDALAPHQHKALDSLIYNVYHNDNKILEKDNAGWINDIASKTRPQHPNTGSTITKHIKDAFKTINRVPPTATDNVMPRLISVVAPNFKPQLGTNIPSIKKFSYKTAAAPMEYRFCTQAQRHEGKPRISPLFKRFLQISANKFPEKKITHIYFNNLGYDRNPLDVAGSYERELSITLHELEQDPTLKVMVITLPASKGLMAGSDYQKTQEWLIDREVFKELLTVAQGSPHKSGITDFVMSPEARQTLFGSPKEETQTLTTLLKNSFIAQGITNGTLISTAQRQAVWVHFIKYELTHYIINKVSPESYNFTCKDAIDRGAVSSTYYNLMKSFVENKPISKDEFERSLDAAAANVKGRGMNFHRKIIWNALDAYVNAHYDELIKNKQKSWLVYWRDMNCPHKRVEELIPIRIKQAEQFFKSIDLANNGELRACYHALFRAARTLNEKNISGKRLLLEAISRTSELVTTPSSELMQNYKALSKELTVNHPTLLIIGGIMEMILGALLFIPSVGYSHSLIAQGHATFKTGFFYQQRNELIEKMEEFQDLASLG